MYELLVTGMKWNDVIKMGSRSAGTTGTQSTDYGITTGSPTQHVHRPPHLSEFTVWLKRTLGTTAFVWGRLVKFTKLREISDRLTGAYTSLKFNTSELYFGNTKFYGQFWQLGRFFIQCTHSIKLRHDH